MAKDNLSAVMGVMKGTFTQPMPDGKGGTVSRPTGRAFAINMCTVGIWNHQGRMDEGVPVLGQPDLLSKDRFSLRTLVPASRALR